jgi:hypothetical protein
MFNDPDISDWRACPLSVSTLLSIRPRITAPTQSGAEKSRAPKRPGVGYRAAVFTQRGQEQKAIHHSSSDSNRDIQISFSRHTAATSSGAIDKLKLKAQIQKLKAEELTLRTALPDYVQKLILGYELRTYYFEVIESLRKLAIVCLPVFFRPSGSISQLTFGLMVCFLSFGVHALYNPYVKREDDRLAQLCQVTSLRAL